MKQMPMIQKYMTTMPHSIGADMPLKKASELMTTNRIRHLPVQSAGKLVGVLTDRDLKLAMSFSGAETLNVEDVMTQDAYTVAPETPLNRVVSEMAEHKYGCAIIQQQNGKVVGIFTSIDGLRVCSEILGSNFRPVMD